MVNSITIDGEKVKKNAKIVVDGVETTLETLITAFNAYELKKSKGRAYKNQRYLEKKQKKVQTSVDK